MPSSPSSATKLTSKQAKVIWPPEIVRDMKTLDYDLFKKIVKVPYVITSTDQVAKVNKTLKSFYLKMPAFKPVIVDPDQANSNRIFLNPDLLTDIEMSKKIQQLEPSLVPVLAGEPKYLGFQDITLTYNNFVYHDVFRAILPENIDSISGFSTIGHIIHLNLRDEALPYKHLIGQVLLDKVKGCRLVINKLDIIDTTFRNFAMEVLAKDDSEPEPNTIVSTTESDIRFKFDFAKVYWNPRLSAERKRISSKMRHSVDILYDVFAGVGPFALFAAKFMKCRVLANDLNPESYRWLSENVQLNKVGKLISCSNLDGREFILQNVKNDLIERIKSFDGIDSNRSYHVVMNLPDIAVEFLDAFSGLLSSIRHEDYSYKIPHLDIHCYCFVKNIPESEAKDYVIQLASTKLGHQIQAEDIDEVYDVRKVAPAKNMYRISFRLSQDILYGSSLAEQQQCADQSDGGDLVANKRLKTE